jgi:hypothetical protein
MEYTHSVHSITFASLWFQKAGGYDNHIHHLSQPDYHGDNTLVIQAVTINLTMLDI